MTQLTGGGLEKLYLTPVTHNLCGSGDDNDELSAESLKIVISVLAFCGQLADDMQHLPRKMLCFVPDEKMRPSAENVSIALMREDCERTRLCLFVSRQ